MVVYKACDFYDYVLQAYFDEVKLVAVNKQYLSKSSTKSDHTVSEIFERYFILSEQNAEGLKF